MDRINVQSEGDTSGHLQQQKPGNSSNLSAESSDQSEMGVYKSPLWTSTWKT